VVDPVVISVLKGEPTPDELAALVIALLARAPEQRAACVARSRWRALGLRGRSWQGPTTWSAGLRQWTYPRS
jgi:hypothetical protein